MNTYNKVAAAAAVILFTTSVAQAGIMGFGVDGGINWSAGQMKNSSGTIAGRTMNTFAFDVMPGYNLGPVFVGVPFEYHLVGQNTAVADVSNTNMKGSGYLLGLGARMDLWLLQAGAGIEFLGSHSLSLADPSGLSLSYQKPLGFYLDAGYPLMPNITADLRMNWASYSQSTVGGTAKSISDNKLTSWNVGVGGTYHW